MIFYIWGWSSSGGHALHIEKNNLCTCWSYHKSQLWNNSFMAISNYTMYLNFQGCYIFDNLEDFKLNGNPDQKSNVRFFTFTVKNIKINNLFFRVPNKNISGLPYLIRGLDNFDKNHIFQILIFLRFNPC